MQPTTCSVFRQDPDDDVVYETVATLPYQICVSSQYSNCVGVIKGKTNYYKTNPSTQSKGACNNLGQAIADAIAEGSCPAALGTRGNNYASLNVWPYNTPIGAGAATTCLPDPVDQPAIFLAASCGSRLQ
jgi:hypothetical protein